MSHANPTPVEREARSPCVGPAAQLSSTARAPPPAQPACTPLRIRIRGPQTSTDPVREAAVARSPAHCRYGNPGTVPLPPRRRCPCGKGSPNQLHVLASSSTSWAREALPQRSSTSVRMPTPLPSCPCRTIASMVPTPRPPLVREIAWRNPMSSRKNSASVTARTGRKLLDSSKGADVSCSEPRECRSIPIPNERAREGVARYCRDSPPPLTQ